MQPLWKTLWRFLKKLKIELLGTSLVAQWLRIRLPMQGTWVQSLVQEDPTCCGATKPVRHNYRACTLEPTSHNYRARAPQLLKPTRLEPVLCKKKSPRTATESSPCSQQLETARAQQRRPDTSQKKKKKNKVINFKKIGLKK